MRRLLRPKGVRPAAQVPRPATAVSQPIGPAPVSVDLIDHVDTAPAFVPETSGWRHVHLGLERQPLRIGGHEVWGSPWVPADQPPLTLVHPVYPLRRLSYSVFTFPEPAHPQHFAACELQQGVWSFATRWDDPSDVLGSIPNVLLQYGCRPNPTGTRAGQTPMTAVLIDAASRQVIADCNAWNFSFITPQADGSLFLSVSESLFDVLFRIDPSRRQFRNLGEGGSDQPLGELAGALDQAHRAIAKLPRDPARRSISPDGTIRVDLDAVEWSNSHWVLSPRVIESASGRVVLDLWHGQWDASIGFSGRRSVNLDLSHYRGGMVSVDMDLLHDTYRIVGGRGLETHRSTGSLPGLAEALATLASLAKVQASAGPVAPAGRVVAWRSALVILALTLAAIGAASYLSLRGDSVAGGTAVPLATVPKPR